MKSEKGKSKYILILGILFIFISLVIILINTISCKFKDSTEKKLIKDYYNQKNQEIDNQSKTKDNKNENQIIFNKVNYVAVLRIPKINLEKGLVSKNSKFNNVRYNIQILNESDTPDIINGNVILAAHSGNARYSFFKNLYKLNNEDIVIIDYSNKSYLYKVVDIYDVEKTGFVNIKKRNKSTLTLITCRRNTNKQIVIICELQ